MESRQELKMSVTIRYVRARQHVVCAGGGRQSTSMPMHGGGEGGGGEGKKSEEGEVSERRAVQCAESPGCQSGVCAVEGP